MLKPTFKDFGGLYEYQQAYSSYFHLHFKKSLYLFQNKIAWQAMLLSKVCNVNDFRNESETEPHTAR